MRASRRLIPLIALLAISAANRGLAHPGASIELGRDGRVYFVDTGRGIFEIGRDGRLKRLDGPAFHWFTIDVSSRHVKTAWPAIQGGELRSVGLDPTLVLSSDVPVTIGRDGALYYPQLEGDRQRRIIRVGPSGSPAIHAQLPAEARSDGSPSRVNGIAAGADGYLYYTHDKTVRRISQRGVVSTVAADVTVPECAPIPGIGPELRPYLRGLDVASDGAVFVAAAGCGAVLKITAAGQITPVLRTISPYSPTAVAVSDGEVYVLEYLHTASDNREEWLARVRKLTARGAVVTLADLKR
jgi:hypothetical protein